jgi:16S rRNA (adenine1518-N6/adenine1519-N6)-dimethyltransferase
MNTPREILDHYAIKPQKKLGQSFLVEPESIRRIADAAFVQENDIIVEIGSGIGVLTEYLAQKAAKVIAVEFDGELIPVLNDRLAKYKNIQIHQGNILRFDFRATAAEEGRKIKVVGNIPYNISSPLLFYLLSFRDVIGSFILMMQKEFVERLAAPPGNKSYGVPSVILQMFADVEIVMNIPAAYFHPRPKVESSVMRGLFLENPVVELKDEELFVRLVRDSFAQRRKMLMNNLKNSKLPENMPETFLKEILISAGIDPARRAETLSVIEFGNLSNIIKDRIDR